MLERSYKRVSFLWYFTGSTTHKHNPRLGNGVWIKSTDVSFSTLSGIHPHSPRRRRTHSMANATTHSHPKAPRGQFSDEDSVHRMTDERASAVKERPSVRLSIESSVLCPSRAHSLRQWQRLHFPLPLHSSSLRSGGRSVSVCHLTCSSINYLFLVRTAPSSFSLPHRLRLTN